MRPALIKNCGPEDADAWDGFVTAAGGTYCHLFAWKGILENSYRLRTLYMAFIRDGRWIAVCPIARVPGFSPRAISLPYCNYGGMIVAEGEDGAALRQQAVAWLAEQGIRRVEFREPGGGQGAEVTMILDLPANTEILWKTVGDKVRNQIRKAQRHDLELRWGRDQVGDLYHIYASTMGRLGTPVHTRRFFPAILDGLGKQADILTVRLKGRPIASMLVARQETSWADPFAASLADYKDLNPNMLMYWEALRSACESGAHHFDFGRSKRHSGTYRFKKQWGAKEVMLDYYTVRNGLRVSQAATDIYRGNMAGQVARAWRHLPPIVQNTMGPVLRRYLY